MSRLSGFIIIVFALGINLLGFFGVAKLVLPTNADIVAGVLSFIGSIFGGLITFLGVKYTLEHGVNEKSLEKMNVKIFLVEDLIMKLKSPFNAMFFIESATNYSEDEKIIHLKRLLTRFSGVFEEEFPKLRTELDYDFVLILEFQNKTMSNRVFLMNNSNVKNEEVLDLVGKARDIFEVLLNQSKIHLEEYYRLKKRQKKIIG